MSPRPAARLAAEFTGTAFLLATVVGSGIMAERLADGNGALALLANAIATGVILYVLITAISPVSGAHFNPAVTLAFALRREIAVPATVGFVAAQVAGGLVGVWAAHLMFEQAVLQASITAAYWFTASTSFANPAVTVARAFTDTFSGFRPADAPALIAAQFVGAALAWAFFRWLFADRAAPAG